ncbi:hypothetical protein GVX81_09115 [[Haemophilus] felis]|nr:hypothetical protein [[Haemophilus] felis]NBI41842.1 hypothetical protein [[Haemophilus] felis]
MFNLSTQDLQRIHMLLEQAELTLGNMKKIRNEFQKRVLFKLENNPNSNSLDKVA